MMRARLALVLATASVGLAGCQADRLTPPDFTDGPAASVQQDFLSLVPEPAMTPGQRTQLSVIRGREGAGEVRLARLADAPGQMLRRGSALRLGVAPGVQVVALGQSVQQRSATDVSWAGPLQGAEGWAQMVYADGEVVATVQVGDDVYNVEPLGNGLHAVSRLDASTLPPEHPEEHPSGALSDAIIDAADAFRAAKPATGGTEGDVSLLALTNLRVMVVYTASASSAAGNLSSRIQLAFDEANQSYVNSGVNISLTKAHVAQVTYSESGRSFSTHVNYLKGTTDGYMDNVHSLRNTYTADVVVLVVNDSEACGVAAAIKAVASSSFAVVHYSCMTGYYSFGHEIGHLQGARHDRYVDSSTSPYAYGHGFIPSSKSWRTVMAYGNNCGNCTRINYWSNPYKTYGGVAMGTTTYENNARVLNNTAGTMAAFR